MKQNNHDSLICEITYRRQYNKLYPEQVQKYNKTDDKDYERNYNRQYYLTVTKPKRERLKEKRHEKASKRMGTLANI